MLLHSERLQAPGAQPLRSALFLHGILGLGSNLRSVARACVERRPSYQGLLLDLRGHGKSLAAQSPDTLEACAEDVVETVGRALPPVEAVIGHSFGGKVALLVAERLQTVRQVVMLDSAPGTRVDARGSELTLKVLSVLESLAGPFRTREEFMARLESEGLSSDLARWLAMNLTRVGEVYQFGPSPSRIRTLLSAYFHTDLWPLLETLLRERSVEFQEVIGGKSLVFDSQEIARARSLKALGAKVTVLPNAGHWVHVDDFEGTVSAIVSGLRV